MPYQLKKQRKFPQSGCIDPSLSLAPHVQENAISHIENMSRSEKDILSVLLGLYMVTEYSRIHPSLDYIAEKCKKSLSTVKRATRRFTKDGIISKFQSGFNKSNLYKLHPMFADENVRKDLRFVFKCFYFLPIAMLMVVPGWSNIVSQRKHYIFERVTSYQENRNKVNNNPLGIQVGGQTQKTGKKSQKGGGSIRKERIKRMDPRDYKNIERLNLTEAGVIKLSAFPPEAIAYAMTRLQGFTNPIDDPCRFVFGLSKKWCEEKGIKPNFRETSFLLSKRGYTFDTPSINAENPFIMKPGVVPQADRIDKTTKAALASCAPLPPEKRATEEDWKRAEEMLAKIFKGY